MSKLDCEVVRDLLPNYIEGLTGEETRAQIDEHLSECPACAESLRSMKEPLPASDAAEDMAAELSFLKKNKRRNRRMLWIAAAAVASALAAFLIKGFIIGRSAGGEGITSLSVDGAHLYVGGKIMDDTREFSYVGIKEKEGVVNVVYRTALAGPFYKDSFKKDYWAKENIKEVRFNGKKVWPTEDGFSEAMQRDLYKQWTDWDAMEDMEKMLSSTLPGSYCRYFTGTGTEEALAYFGREILLPFEEAEGFVPANTAGVTAQNEAGEESDLVAAHCRVICTGVRGSVYEATFTAGYNYDGARIVFNATAYAESAANINVSDGELVTEYDNWRDYHGSEEPAHYEAANITFFKDGIRYSIRVVSLEGREKLDAAVEKVKAVLNEMRNA